MSLIASQADRRYPASIRSVHAGLQEGHCRFGAPRIASVLHFDDVEEHSLLIAASLLNEIDADGVSDQFRRGFQAEILHNLVLVRLGSSCRYVQYLSDFLHCPPLREQP